MNYKQGVVIFMKINKSIIALAFLATFSLNAHSAENGAGTIHFTGEIIEPSCTIDGDSGSDLNVPLGTWPTSLFSTVGVESEPVYIDIKLVDCPVTSDGLSAVQLTFNGTTALTGSNTLLDVSQISTSGDKAATGVGIALSPADKPTQLLAFDGSEGQVYINLPTVSTDSVWAHLQARYKSFATEVTPGPADADLTVNIVYH
ncbi:fimbrial protein [Kluyvera georgiana]|uniref:fimbrial protein n=2 Tax=Kluyvera georgiana TaxID=73098 RepID=UPI001F0AB830|nr:fimbrial protein [Kluyvera georgiana]